MERRRMRKSADVPLRGATHGYPSFNLFEVAECARLERARRTKLKRVGLTRLDPFKDVSA